MAMANSNPFLCHFRVSHCSKSIVYQRNSFCKGPVSTSLFSSSRFLKTRPKHYKMVCHATSATGSSCADSDENPYEVLGVSPIEGFDMIKAAYTRKHKDAERRGDEAFKAQMGYLIFPNTSVFQLERAYDKIMMAQLKNRKKGLTVGSFQVSKDIKYADKQPIVPWGPRFTKSSERDMHINMAISAVFMFNILGRFPTVTPREASDVNEHYSKTAWVAIKRNAEWKPLQFLAFVFVYRIFEKLKAFEPPVSPTFTEDGEDEGRTLRMGKRLLRSLALVFSCMAVSSLAFTGLLNLIELLGHYIPVFLYNNQELLVTTSTAVMLYFMASYYR